MLVDTHCHLNREVEEGDLQNILTRAKEAGVEIIVAASAAENEFDENIMLANTFPFIYTILGVHPEDSLTDTDRLFKLAHHPKVIGIGEIGLDYHGSEVSREKQIEQFKKQIDIARRLKLPICIHARKADEDMMEILKGEKLEQTGLLHCYSSGEELAKTGLDLGYFFSFSGIITFKNSVNVIDIVKKIPLDRIVIETDAPFLAPTPYRGKKNEPAYLKLTALALAEIKGVSFQEIEERTTENFYRIFPKVKRKDKN